MSDDTISRQAAIDALERIFNQCEEIEAHFPDGDPDKTGYKMFPDYMTVWKYLHQLPSAERHGYWEYTKELYRDPNGNHLFYGKICSECNSVSPYDSPYCMNCGAKMGEVEK